MVEENKIVKLIVEFEDGSREIMLVKEMVALVRITDNQVANIISCSNEFVDFTHEIINDIKKEILTESLSDLS